MITVDQHHLARAVTTAATPIGGKSPMPILNGFRIDASGGVLSIVGTDLTTTVRARCAAVGTLAPIVVSLAFAERVKLMPPGPLTIAVDGKTLAIASGKRKFKLDTLDAADFPNVEIAEPAGDPIDAAALAVAIQRGAVSMSADLTRTERACAGFVNGKIQSTDGHRISIAPSPVNITAVLPKPAVDNIAKFLGGSKQGVRVALDGNRVVVSREDAAISSATIDVTMPPIDHIVGAFGAVRLDGPFMRVSRAALMDVLRAVSAASNVETRSVAVAAKRGELRVHAGDAGEDAIPCELTGEIGFGVNSTYLISLLQASDGDEVTIRSAGDFDPVLIEGESTRHVVMPVRPEFVRKTA